MSVTKKRITLFQVPIDPLTISDVLEKIKLYLSALPKFIHIVSVNPENIVIAQHNSSFLAVCKNADLALTDGIGVILGAKLLGISLPERVSGSVLLPQLLDLAGAMSLRVVLIGSQANLANIIAKCYARSYPKATFIGMEGYKNVQFPTQEEEQHVEDIVRSTRPHFVFVAFGSPYQELWIDTHKKLLCTSICMGVGGGFDYLSGASQKPPNSVRSFGLEWLYRLIRQPHRMRRQGSRLPIFVGMVFKRWFWCIMHPR
ncbi:MAG: WecB/TagA/CpsF family glycosyltransferase [bacterium]